MPHDGLIPLVILATVATVIASQAVISGAFSIAHQAAQLGYLPRLQVVHTSKRAYGQVYVPVINRLLLVAVLTLVLAFQSSAKLAFAYGTAVTGTILVTSVLFFFIVRHRWHRPLWLTLAGAAFFLTIELGFFASNLTKIAHGAWLPLTIGFVLFFVMVTWYRGRELVTAERFRVEGPLRDFVKEVRAHRSPGVPGARDRRLPEPREGDGAALDARLRRSPALASRKRGHPLAGDAPGPQDQAQGAARDRRPRLSGRPSHLRPGQARLRRGVRRAEAGQADLEGRGGVPGRRATRRRSTSPGWS